MANKQQYGKWKVIGNIAKGKIFKVQAEGSDIPFVLKIHKPEVMQRIKELTAGILHPNVLTVVDFGIEGDNHYSVSEYCEFGDLTTLETSSHHWIRLACQTFDATEFLHCAGLRKSDNNSKNVFVKKGYNGQLSAVIGDLDSLSLSPGQIKGRMGSLYNFFYQKIEDQGHQRQLMERCKRYNKIVGSISKKMSEINT